MTFQSTPKISVVMPSYNHAEYIKCAIDSVLAQKDVSFELLIYDDSSSDNTDQVLRDVKDERVTYTLGRNNKGACSSLNYLINSSRGEYIAVINSDDVWSSENKLRYQLDMLEANKDLAACFCQVAYINSVGEELSKDSLSFGRTFEQANRDRASWLRSFFEVGNTLCHPSVLIRRSCYLELGLYDNRYRQLPDLDFWVRLVKKYDIYVSEKSFVNFRILDGRNASSPTYSNSLRTVNEHRLIFSSFFSDMDDDLFVAGFGDRFNIVSELSKYHLEIEKALLFFRSKGHLRKVYTSIGYDRLHYLLGRDEYRSILKSDYSIDDFWLNEISGILPFYWAGRPRLGYSISGRLLSFLRRILRR